MTARRRPRRRLRATRFPSGAARALMLTSLFSEVRRPAAGPQPGPEARLRLCFIRCTSPNREAAEEAFPRSARTRSQGSASAGTVSVAARSS